MSRARARVHAVVLVLGLTAACAGAGGAGDGAANESPSDAAGTVTVLAAASLTDAVTRVADDVQAEHPGLTVVTSYAGSAELVQQVLAGAPADVLVTASEAAMAPAVEAGAVAGKPVVIAENEVVLAVPAGNPAGVGGPADLAREELDVALCAEQVPCGAAGRAVLDAAGVVARPDTLESDVRAVLTRLRLGEVDAGLVYRTDVVASAGTVETVDLPVAVAGKGTTRYPAAVLADAPNRAGAAAVVEGLLSPAGREVLTRAGFRVP
ncbi:molybdate ABC transporter substrate-binding protein [Thalassiella azotivora]